MKSILISIQPKWVEKILNGEKTIEIRKTYPKCELPIKVYVYCAYGKRLLNFSNEIYSCCLLDDNITKTKPKKLYRGNIINGKVISEFVLNNTEVIRSIHGITNDGHGSFQCHELNDNILTKSCMTQEEILNYTSGKDLYAWHIDNLKIYNEPKELNDFYKPLSDNDLENGNYDIDCGGEVSCMDYPEGGDFCATCKYGGAKPLKKAPSGFCYVEEV